MEKEPEDFWLSLLKRYLVDPPSVTVRGMPSCEEDKTMTESEKSRIEKQKALLGEKGLQEMSEKLVKATEENEVGSLFLFSRFL